MSAQKRGLPDVTRRALPDCDMSTLGDQLHRPTQQLERALRRQRELNRLQRDFAVMAWHEFGTPLAIIDSQAQGIARLADQLTPQDLQRRIGKIRTAVRRMSEIVSRSLHVASSSLAHSDELDALAGDDDLVDNPATGRRAEISLLRLLHESCRRYQELSGAHEVIEDLTDLPNIIWGSEVSIRQIFDNLLSNAIKYAPDGGPIQVTGRSERHAAVILVRDQGLGIPEQEMDMIFRPFFRGSNTTGISGTGCGLALVKKQIAEHGGSIDVESREGLGSTFTVRLPIDLRGAGRPAQPSLPRPKRPTP